MGFRLGPFWVGMVLFCFLSAPGILMKVEAFRALFCFRWAFMRNAQENTQRIDPKNLLCAAPVLKKRKAHIAQQH